MFEGETFARDRPRVNHKRLLATLGLASGLRWETYTFIKGGAARGVNFGSLTMACYEQTKKADDLIAFVVGADAGILPPGYYSKEMIAIVIK